MNKGGGGKEAQKKKMVPLKQQLMVEKVNILHVERCQVHLDKY